MASAAALQIFIKEPIQYRVLSRLIDSLLQCHFGILLHVHVFTYFVVGQFIHKELGIIVSKIFLFCEELAGIVGSKMLCSVAVVKHCLIRQTLIRSSWMGNL